MEQVAVYLLEDGRLREAAGRGTTEGHEDVAAELLGAALGPLRARAAVHASVGGTEPVLERARRASRRQDSRRRSRCRCTCTTSRSACSSCTRGGGRSRATDVTLLAVARRAARGRRAERAPPRALEGARRGARLRARVGTTDVAAGTGALRDLAVLRAEPVARHHARCRHGDDRRRAGCRRGGHPRAGRARRPVRAARRARRRLPARRARARRSSTAPQPRPARTHGASLLDAAAAARLGGAHALLIPFLDKGSTAALLPIATASELLAELTILSLDPADPIDGETIAAAGTIAQQAALAIDNARLYQQQKAVRRDDAAVAAAARAAGRAGLEVGAVYESAAQVDVGGDVFDFLELADGRLAVVLGDVTGHGIDATADMAMAKFVFRSLAREHSEPSRLPRARQRRRRRRDRARGSSSRWRTSTVDPAGPVLVRERRSPGAAVAPPGRPRRAARVRRPRARDRRRVRRTSRRAPTSGPARRSSSTPTV